MLEILVLLGEGTSLTSTVVEFKEKQVKHTKEKKKFSAVPKVRAENCV